VINLQFHDKGLYKMYYKIGYSQNSGLEDFEPEMELINGSTDYVMMDLKPVGNLILAAGYAWKVGQRNKFYVEAGYAVPLTGDYYELHDDNVALSSTSKQALKILRPGGLIVALGINFALGK